MAGDEKGNEGTRERGSQRLIAISFPSSLVPSFPLPSAVTIRQFYDWLLAHIELLRRGLAALGG